MATKPEAATVAEDVGTKEKEKLDGNINKIRKWGSIIVTLLCLFATWHMPSTSAPRYTDRSALPTGELAPDIEASFWDAKECKERPMLKDETIIPVPFGPPESGKTYCVEPDPQRPCLLYLPNVPRVVSKHPDRGFSSVGSANFIRFGSTNPKGENVQVFLRPYANHYRSECPTSVTLR